MRPYFLVGVVSYSLGMIAGAVVMACLMIGKQGDNRKGTYTTCSVDENFNIKLHECMKFCNETSCLGCNHVRPE
jgi:hypothetical protein